MNRRGPWDRAVGQAGWSRSCLGGNGPDLEDQLAKSGVGHYLRSGQRGQPGGGAELTDTEREGDGHRRSRRAGVVPEAGAIKPQVRIRREACGDRRVGLFPGGGWRISPPYQRSGADKISQLNTLLVICGWFTNCMLCLPRGTAASAVAFPNLVT